MIRNIIFDMGNVLKYFIPLKLIAKYTEDPEETKLLYREVFRETEWIALDAGAISTEDAIASINQRLPEKLHAYCKGLIRNWWKDEFDDVEGMDELIGKLHENGYHMYLLSNATYNQAEYADRLPGWRYFEGRITSAEVKLLKPNRAIYELCLSTFGLKAEECIFIDDSAANVFAAKQCGIDGIVFHDDLQLLKRRLSEKGIRCE